MESSTYIFYEYPPCSTCKKAKKHLQARNVKFEAFHIVSQTPSVEQLQKWITTYTIDIQKLFNTSGNVYKELHLKDRMSSLSIEDKLSLLAGNGMLIKRPILVSDHDILIGYKEQAYEELLQR